VLLLGGELESPPKKNENTDAEKADEKKAVVSAGDEKDPSRFDSAGNPMNPKSGSSASIDSVGVLNGAYVFSAPTRTLDAIKGCGPFSTRRFARKPKTRTWTSPFVARRSCRRCGR
jgi:hypothetical protein